MATAPIHLQPQAARPNAPTLRDQLTRLRDGLSDTNTALATLDIEDVADDSLRAIKEAEELTKEATRRLTTVIGRVIAAQAEAA